MKYLNPRVHGYLDYVADAIFLLAPSIFGFAGVAATLCYVIGIGHLVMNLVTDYPLGATKLLPFPVHGGIELVASVALILLPFIAGFSDTVSARNFFVASGVVLFGVWLTTDYRRTAASTIGVRTDDITFRRAG